MVPLLEPVGILILVGLSAMFSAAETAIQSLGQSRAKFLGNQGRSAKLLRLWPHNRLLVLTTILIGNNLVNITATALATAYINGLVAGGWGLTIAIGGMTFLILTFGEIIPKSYAIGNAETFCRWVLPLLTPFYFLFLGASLGMTRLTRLLLRFAGGSTHYKAHMVSEEEFRFLLEQGSNLDEKKEAMLSSIFEYHQTMVKEIMIPRTDVIALDTDADNAEMLSSIAGGDMFSRYPVYEDNLDNIIGIFNVKELLKFLKQDTLENFKMRKALRKPIYVPQTKKISELFRDMQRKKFHMAVAVDEFGGTAGIVTMEDIIEEIFGEIYDEFDKQDVQIKKLAEGRFMADARIAIRDLGEVLEIELPDEGEYETLGGFLMLNAGRVPELNSTIEWNGLTFTIRDCDSKSINQVEINRPPASAPASK